ncbi:helix-turn-helix domain-containing protein [Methylobacterium nigriterrae]|uniref:helix-turn-helix domain-containing protein n=1 Tax=Methylobacterium nigriterrae TaxID=3127512 RepID=UPI0030134CF0
MSLKRQVVQAPLSGERPRGLALRHDLSRNLIRTWIAGHEPGVLDKDVQTVDRLRECKARIAALQRLDGRQALEIEFLKGGCGAPPPGSVTTSVVAGPPISRSAEEAP